MGIITEEFRICDNCKEKEEDTSGSEVVIKNIEEWNKTKYKADVCLIDIGIMYGEDLCFDCWNDVRLEEI